MQLTARIGLLAVLLALVKNAHAATVAVTQISCGYLYFTLSLTTAESQNAQYLGVYQGTTMISEIQFNAAYANTNTYQWYAPFFSGVTVNSGPQPISFRLLDANEDPIPAYPAITQTLNFQCGTTVTTSSAASSAPTSSASSGTGSSGSSGSSGSTNSGSAASNGGSSSGSSSPVGAIAGGVVGGVAALAIVGLLAFCMRRNKKKQQAQQSRLRNDEADEAAFRAPNNDSTTSLATAPDTANTPMMRDVSTKNVFADPTSSIAPSGSSTQYTGTNNKAGSSVDAAGAVAAAAVGGIGAAAIAARKQSREQSRAQSPSHASERNPSSEFSKDNVSPSSQLPPPMPALPASAPAPAPTPVQATAASAPAEANSAAVPQQTDTAPVQAPASPPASEDLISASEPASGAQTSSTAPIAASAAAAAAVGAGTTADRKDSKPKTSKWGFKRASKDAGSSNKLPYPQAVAEPTAAPAPAPAPALAPAPGHAPTPTPAAASPSPTSNSPEAPASPSRSFKVMQKSPVAPPSTAGPSSASIAPSESSLNRTPVFSSRSGQATPAGSIRGANYSRAPSVASMSAGFTDAAAPPLPSGAASVASVPVSEFGGNMAGIGAGRSFAASSGNSTKWHQQSYNIMPSFSHRALARSTQLEEDLIFGHLGMGLSPPPGPAGNGSETGSSKSRTDPFGDR